MVDLKHILKKIFEPKLSKILTVVIIAVLIFVIGIFATYCSGDMCFSMVHMISGDRYYFLSANIIKYVSITLFSYAGLCLLYGAVMHFQKKPDKRQKTSKKKN